MKLNMARAMMRETRYDGWDLAYYAHEDRSTQRILDVVKERKGMGASAAKLCCLMAYEDRDRRRTKHRGVKSKRRRLRFRLPRVRRGSPRGGRFTLSPLALELMDAYGPGCGLMYSRPLFHAMNAWAEEARREPTWRDLLSAWGPAMFKRQPMKPQRLPGGGGRAR